VDIHHISADESDTIPKNLAWACRPCNVRIGNVMRTAGIGRLTRQFNPAEGAPNLGAYVNAVLSLRGDPGGNMPIADAVTLVQATPAPERSKFARQIWAIRKRRHGASGREVPF
jgi:hypothetical protein